ncbi:polymorphic toxin type 23 domain-containing protein [Halomicronema sp. CCY15110]|uniref:polymorphic toxin type 23 domain-containing protein n=1 Tax=Halomicronema sp. CCY15110 TaxID=2767773 RepID=UPI001951FD7F|nr:polymorphic toxin type 23 domain-containing protein [Halomicronema sp. CCY15110]
MFAPMLMAQLSVDQTANIATGVRAGLSYQFGTQGNRVGFNAGGFARVNPDNLESFISWSGYRNLSHIETAESGWESQVTVGLTHGFGGGRSLPEDYDWSLAANNTQRTNSVSLYATFYDDTYNTSQGNIGIGLNVGAFNLRFENDFDPIGILGEYGDRFRTGALEVGYRADDGTNFVAGFNTFTGDIGDGYIIRPEDGGAGPHGEYSLTERNGRPIEASDRAIGNAYVGIRNLDLTQSDDDTWHALGFDNLQVRVGWSDEAIRNGVQNSLHDLLANPRIPLRDVEGHPYVQVGTNHGQTLYP